VPARVTNVGYREQTASPRTIEFPLVRDVSTSLVGKHEAMMTNMLAGNVGTSAYIYGCLEDEQGL
jgi:hypothetical protein